MASVRRDFFLDPAHRLTEQERALMTAMLNDLVDSVAGEVQAALAGNGGRTMDSTAIASSLAMAGLLDREELVSLLLRRADEHRIATAFAGRAGPRKLPLLPRLIGDDEPAVAAAAMALVVARGRRRDAFGQPRIELNDLPPREDQFLVFFVASALAASGMAERADAASAAAVVASGSATDSLDGAVQGLVDSLAAAGRADDAMAEAAAEDGEASLLAALLALRAGVSTDTAWGYLVGGQDGGLALLGRMAGLGRPTAARLIAEYATLSGASVEEEIVGFDRLAASEVEAALQWWRLPPEFRSATAALGGGIG